MNDLDRYLIESVALKHDHGGLTPADDGLPAGLAAGNIIAHTGTGPVLGVIRAVSAECLLQRRGIVPTSKTDWTVGADCWVDDATGAWTETAQPDPDLWVGRAVTNDRIEVLCNDTDAERPWTMGLVALAPCTVAHGATATGYIDLSDRRHRGYVLVVPSVKFGATPDGNARVDIEATTDGTTYATVELYQITLTASANNVVSVPIPVPADVAPKLKITIENLDTADDLTLVGITYALAG